MSKHNRHLPGREEQEGLVQEQAGLVLSSIGGVIMDQSELGVDGVPDLPHGVSVTSWLCGDTGDTTS